MHSMAPAPARRNRQLGTGRHASPLLTSGTLGLQPLALCPARLLSSA